MIPAEPRADCELALAHGVSRGYISNISCGHYSRRAA